MMDTPEEVLTTIGWLLRETEKRCGTPFESAKIHLVIAAMISRACEQNERKFLELCAASFHAAHSTQQAKWFVSSLLKDDGAAVTMAKTLDKELVESWLRGGKGKPRGTD